MKTDLHFYQIFHRFFFSSRYFKHSNVKKTSLSIEPYRLFLILHQVILWVIYDFSLFVVDISKSESSRCFECAIFLGRISLNLESMKWTMPINSFNTSVTQIRWYKKKWIGANTHTHIKCPQFDIWNGDNRLVWSPVKIIWLKSIYFG